MTTLPLNKWRGYDLYNMAVANCAKICQGHYHAQSWHENRKIMFYTHTGEQLIDNVRQVVGKNAVDKVGAIGISAQACDFLLVPRWGGYSFGHTTRDIQ